MFVELGAWVDVFKKACSLDKGCFRKRETQTGYLPCLRLLNRQQVLRANETQLCTYVFYTR